MAVYAKMKLRQEDGKIKEETRLWVDHRIITVISMDADESYSEGHYTYSTRTSEDAFNHFIKNREAIISACGLENLVAIKFYDDDFIEAADWEGGWLHFPRDE